MQRCAERALKSIPNLCSSSKSVPTASFRSFTGPNSYVSWTPLIGYLFHDLDEPYLVYLGDSKGERERSEKLYDQMSKDYESITGKSIYPQSDGEIEENGQFRLALPSSSGRGSSGVCDSLDAVRLRAAQRHAIYAIVLRYGSSEEVFGTLSDALCMGNPRRVVLFFDVARTRRRAEEQRRVLLHSISSFTKDIERALLHPEADGEDDLKMLRNVTDRNSLLDLVQNPTANRHFCRTCMLFACGLHNDTNTIPRVPIPDPIRDERVFRLSKRLTEPCSLECFLTSKLPCESECRETFPWQSHEVNLLRESISIFECDPCSLAIVLGTRTCSEVHDKLTDPLERRWAEAIIKLARESARCDQTSKPFPTSVDNHSVQVTTSQKLSRTAGANYPRAAKSRRNDPARANLGVSLAASGEQIVEHPGCDHPGACTLGNKCPCVEKSIYCKSLCRCNGVRYSYNEGTGRIDMVGQDCLQTADYCNCTDGKCDTSSCICRRYHVACTPGGCKCDSHLLPSQVKPRDRRCKNCDFIVGRHKRTFIGNSKVDGLGLFAGEHFERGEIVGVYWGSQWEGDHAYQATVLGDKMNRTYAFEMTNTKTIDATILGSKTRFINHGKTRSKCNCDSAIWHARGKPYICIYTTRSVPAGEEFLFDYKLIAPAGKEWSANFN